MKFNWRWVTIFFLFIACLELILKGSNMPILVGLEPILILYLATLSFGNFWQIHLLFMLFSIVSNLINYLPVGLTLGAGYIAYLIVRSINNVFNLMGEARLLFNLLVLFVALLLINLISLIIFPQQMNFSPVDLVFNIMIFLCCYYILNRVFKKNVFTK